MIVLKATQEKVLSVLQSVAGIVERRHTFAGEVRFVFQHAEEVPPGGAREIAASTTSLTVQPKAFLARLMSSRDARAQSHRRCGPSGPLSTLVGATARRPTLASPTARTAPALARSPGEARPCAAGRIR